MSALAAASLSALAACQGPGQKADASGADEQTLDPAAPEGSLPTEPRTPQVESVNDPADNTPDDPELSQDLDATYNRPRRYIVQVDDEPILPRVKREMGAAPDGNLRARLRTRASEARSEMRSRLGSRRSSVENALGHPIVSRHQYSLAVSGFDAVLTADEAAVVAGLPGVVSVRPEKSYRINTMASVESIKAPALWKAANGRPAVRGEGVVIGVIDTGIRNTHPSFSEQGSDGYVIKNPRGEGKFLGVCDPANPKYDPNFKCNGKLIGAWDFADGKLEGAFTVFEDGETYYGLENDGPWDDHGHGTHVASTAAGNAVPAAGIQGVAPRASLIAYDACMAIRVRKASATPPASSGGVQGQVPSEREVPPPPVDPPTDPEPEPEPEPDPNPKPEPEPEPEPEPDRIPKGGGICPESALVAAVEQAILDEVDVLNYSISGGTEPWNDVVSKAFLAAYETGIFVAASGGNAGPGAGEVNHLEPWVATVGATIKQKESNPILKLTVKTNAGNESATFDALSWALPKDAPRTLDTEVELIKASDLPCPLTDPENAARNCPGGKSDPYCNWGGLPRLEDIKGRILICEYYPQHDFENAIQYYVDDKASGEECDPSKDDCPPPGPAPILPKAVIVLGSNPGRGFTSSRVLYPDDARKSSIEVMGVPYEDAQRLLALYRKPGGARASHTPWSMSKPAWAHADYSSRGPNRFFDVGKPDLAAPGHYVLAAESDPNPNPPLAAEYSGTSMASPHVAGAAALLRQLKPTWTPAEVKSALQTTSDPNVTRRGTSIKSTAYDVGTGFVQLDLAAQAALVLDETPARMASADPAKGGQPGDLNLPNMHADFCPKGCSWKRTLRNATNKTLSFSVKVDTNPSALKIQVTPKTFTIKPNAKQLIDVKVVVPVGVAVPDVAFAKLNLKDSSGAHPQQALTLSVGGMNGRLPRGIDLASTKRSGSLSVKSAGLRDVALPTVSYRTSLVTGDIVAGNVEYGRDFIREFNLPAGVAFVQADILRSKARDVDVFLMRDTTKPYGDETGWVLECVGATGAIQDSCRVLNPEKGLWAVAVNSFSPSDPADGVKDFVEVSIGIVKKTAGQGLTVTGPAKVDPFTPFDMQIDWQAPGLKPNKPHYGWVGIYKPGVEEPVGFVPLSIRSGTSAPLVATPSGAPTAIKGPLSAAHLSSR
ncbi:MAG: S8 family serine peptidase [Myxococcales bacterium]|nr:S8 family serine peptidase [Myxococcales bacterium]